MPCLVGTARHSPFPFGRSCRPGCPAGGDVSGFPVIRRSLIMEKRRFRIVNLEERIAPCSFNPCGGGSHKGGSNKCGGSHHGNSHHGGSNKCGGSHHGGSHKGSSHH